MDNNCDLIKTIEDDQQIPNFSENSDVEDDVRSHINYNIITLYVIIFYNSVKRKNNLFTVQICICVNNLVL